MEDFGLAMRGWRCRGLVGWDVDVSGIELYVR